MFLLDAIMTVAPLFGYYSQYALIKDNRSVGSFSIDLCAILILANILRIGFWFSKGFANNLLVQSFLIITIQLFILELCVRIGYKKKEEIHIERFWRWNTLKPFLIFIAIFSVVVAIITGIFIYLKSQLYGNVIGLVSLSLQATLAFPQLITNQKNKSVEGLSVFMIITWFAGDFFKTIYFIVRNQPLQFVLSGTVQLTVDVLLILQILMYAQGSLSYENVKDENDHGVQVSEHLEK